MIQTLSVFEELINIENRLSALEIKMNDDIILEDFDIVYDINNKPYLGNIKGDMK